MMPDPSPIICYSIVDWVGAHGSMYHYALKLSERRPVIYVEPPVSVIHALQNPARRGPWVARVRAALTGHHFAQVNPYLTIFTPPPLPSLALISASANSRYYRGIARSTSRWLSRFSAAQPIIWSFDPNSPAVCAAIHKAVVVYHATQLFTAAALPRALARIRSDNERRLATAADLVFATTPAIAEFLDGYNDRVHIFPTGVDAGHFASASDPNGALPKEYLQIPGPRIVWIGMLSRAVDTRVLRDIARSLPDASLVLIGGVQRGDRSAFSALCLEPNVYFLGFKAHSDLPQYLRGIEVCVIPYVASAFTDGVSSLKLYEYLAAGKKVVSSAYPEVLQYRDLVWVADTPQQFPALVSEALSDRSAWRGRSAVQVAQANTWDARVDEMLALIAQVG